MKKENLQEKRINVGKLIEILRLKNGFSQSVLAEKVGVKQNTILRIEQGKFSPNTDLFFLIFDCLDTPIIINGLII